MDHPNIIKYYEEYENEKYIYLVMEYCDGGDLYDKIEQVVNQKGVFSEREAVQVVEKLFRAINHCHAHGVCHRDLKPENIMIGKNGELKIIDFGLSKLQLGAARELQTKVGSPFYVAPEILTSNSYGSEVDVWSLGVIMHIMLSGLMPFGGDNTTDILHNVVKCEVDLSKPQFQAVSAEGKALLASIFTKQPAQRPSADSVLKHPWFEVAKQLDAQDDGVLDKKVFDQLISHKGISKLKKAAMNALVRLLEPEDIEHLRQQFYAVDTDKTGLIKPEELMIAMQKLNYNVEGQEI